MSGLSRVLCAVDIDDSAYTAFAQALAIARARDAKLLLVCAVPTGQPFSSRAAERVACLLKIRRQAEAAGVDVFTSVQTGDAADIIVLHARARRADLVVINVEYGRADGALWGAVAEEVLRAAPCPTLVVPAGVAPVSTFTQVVHAVDLEDDEIDAADARTLWHPDSPVTVVHVVSSRRGATAALEQLHAMMPAGGRPPALGRVVVGSVAREVLGVTRKVGADLLVIGARDRSRIGRRLFGVTRQILERTVCPVLALPDRDRRNALALIA